MDRRSLLLLFLALATIAALWLAPADTAWRCRLFLYGLCPRPPRVAADIGEADMVADLRARLCQRDAEIAGLRARLRHIGELREAAPQLRFVAATVIGIAGTRWGESVILDRGRADGVVEGDAVTQGQAIVGVVRRVSDHSAEATLLWSSYFSVAARLAADSPARGAGELWAVQGDGRGGVRAICYSRNTAAREGAMLLTGEAAGAVPPHLLLGVLAGDPSEGIEPGTMEAPLQPAADLRALDDVLIIRRVLAPPLPAKVEDKMPAAPPTSP